MGVPRRKPEPVMLFAGCLYSEGNYLSIAKDELISLLGNIRMESEEKDWHSGYYEDELGSPIKRKFLFFDRLMDPGEIADIKLKTNSIESELSLEGKRKINIDPGYITPARIVLVSTKDYAHRLYLRKGIYGEVTMVYSSKECKFKPHMNTYRDFQDEENLEYFLKAREELKRKLSALEDLKKSLK